ncbi:hypothetical protein AJ78_01765 [Emergomyces pasteurianus Ep9510]|uniref:RNA 3'-terminal phosphate cyclase domain-containing protein n=1 Tax=Emergomyces pasteurianus Ep9510 TaxID=1447872 RepID=A0A1J9QPV6_9EURO|nr:hypothetical protein AJ78_01765 [Emergomyces pasteurianus Ep9510]
MLYLDGSALEGGGQLVRNAVALSALTGRPVTINNIRGKRNGPKGLRRSHTAAIQFLAEVCRGRIDGATVGSSEITFYPRDTGEDGLPSSGMGEDELLSALQRKSSLYPLPLASPIQSEYNICLTTPGSIFLIFQALYPYLVYAGAGLHSKGETAGGSSASQVIRLKITGGTNISFSPSFDYVYQVLIPNFAKLGLPRLSVKLNRRGWSTGAVQIGSVSFEIEPLPIAEVREGMAGPSDTKEAFQYDLKQGKATKNPESDTSKQKDLSTIPPPRFPRIRLENLDPGYITCVDITVLAPDTTLHQAAPFKHSKHSKQAHQRTRTKAKYGQRGTKQFENNYYKRTTLLDPELDVEELEVPGPSPSGAGELYDSPGQAQSIRAFLEDTAIKSVTRALRVFSDNNPRATRQPSPPWETPIVKIHTTEPTDDPLHIYILLVAHTSTGFRLGGGQLYSDYRSKEKNKNCRDTRSEQNMGAVLQGMVNDCVAGVMREFPAMSDTALKDVPGNGPKGCLDTYMRDQVVVFQALGELSEEGENGKSGNQTEEQGLSLHTLTAMWVCEQILGVKV